MRFKLVILILAALWALAGWAQSVNMDTKPLTIAPGAAVGNKVRIKWQVVKPAGVLVQVFDAAGRCVRTLDAGEMAPGDYSVIYDGKDGKGKLLPAGDYTVRVGVTPKAAADLAFGAGGMLGQATRTLIFKDVRKFDLGVKGLNPKAVTLKVDGEAWDQEEDFGLAGDNYKVDAAAGTLEINPTAELDKGAEIAVSFAQGLPLENPWAIKAAPDGSLYICDRLYGLDQANQKPKPRPDVLYKIDASGKPAAAFGRDGAQVMECQDVAVDADGKVYALGEYHAVAVLDPTGKRLYNVAGFNGNYEKGKPHGAYWPRGIALTGDGRLVIMNIDQTVSLFDAAKSDLEGWIASQNGIRYPPVMWQYLSPCIAAQGDDFYETTAYQGIVKYHFDPNTKEFSTVWEMPIVDPGPDIKPNGPAQLWHAMGLTLDGTGLIYVADRTNHRVQIFFDAGATYKHVGSIGSEGAAVDKCQLVAPHAVALSPDGKSLYVAEDGIFVKFGNGPVVTGSSRVVKWTLGVEEKVETKLSVK